jgi:hypothetical protein
MNRWVKYAIIGGSAFFLMAIVKSCTSGSSAPPNYNAPQQRQEQPQQRQEQRQPYSTNPAPVVPQQQRREPTPSQQSYQPVLGVRLPQGYLNYNPANNLGAPSNFTCNAGATRAFKLATNNWTCLRLTVSPASPALTRPRTVFQLPAGYSATDAYGRSAPAGLQCNPGATPAYKTIASKWVCIRPQ